MIPKDLAAASSRPIVMAILAQGEDYGYSIIRRVREASNGDIEWSEGMLYPVLHWLEDVGYVRSVWRKSESGRKRKYYALKPEGRQALRQQKQQWAAVNHTLNQLWIPRYA